MNKSLEQMFHSSLCLPIFSLIFTNPNDSWSAWLDQEITTANKHSEGAEVLKDFCFFISLFKVLIIGLIKPFDVEDSSTLPGFGGKQFRDDDLILLLQNK